MVGGEDWFNNLLSLFKDVGSLGRRTSDKWKKRSYLLTITQTYIFIQDKYRWFKKILNLCHLKNFLSANVEGPIFYSGFLSIL